MSLLLGLLRLNTLNLKTLIKIFEHHIFKVGQDSRTLPNLRREWGEEKSDHNILSAEISIQISIHPSTMGYGTTYHERSRYLVRSLYLLRPVSILQREVHKSDPDRSKLHLVRVEITSRCLYSRYTREGVSMYCFGIKRFVFADMTMI